MGLLSSESLMEKYKIPFDPEIIKAGKQHYVPSLFICEGDYKGALENLDLINTKKLSFERIQKYYCYLGEALHFEENRKKDNGEDNISYEEAKKAYFKSIYFAKESKKPPVVEARISANNLSNIIKNEKGPTGYSSITIHDELSESIISERVNVIELLEWAASKDYAKAYVNLMNIYLDIYDEFASKGIPDFIQKDIKLSGLNEPIRKYLLKKIIEISSRVVEYQTFINEDDLIVSNQIMKLTCMEYMNSGYEVSELAVNTKINCRDLVINRQVNLL